MALYTKCLKCGGWLQLPDAPTEADQFPTGMMMSAPKMPGPPCTCPDNAKGGTRNAE